MAVRETLDLDIRRALAQATQLSSALDKGLTGAAREFEASITQATQKLGNVSAGPITNIGTGLKAVGQEAGQAAQMVAQLGPEADKAAASMFRYQEATLRAREEERRSNEQRRETEQSLQRVGNAAGIAAAAIGVGLGLAVKASMDFEQQISMVGAVSGATAKELGTLRDAAIAAGAATVFSAKEAAEAEVELAKAGITTADILGGALRGSLDLAAAGQLDLARAAEIAAQAMTTFGLRGSDVGHIADVLAAGANKSTASVESLAQGLENAGGVASSLFNITFEETVAVLAAFDQNAVRGAEGGTALRSALLALATPSKQQAELLAQIAEQTGVNIDQFSTLEELAGNLQTAFAGMDDAQRRTAMGIIFGSYGIRAANILYREGAEGIREWTESVDQAGAAQQFASAAMDNLAGDLEALRGSIETGLIGAGSQGNEVLRFMARRATEAVNGLAGLPGPIQAAGFGLTALVGAGLSAVFVLGSLIPKWREVSDALEKSGRMGQFAANNMGTFLKVAAGAAVAVTSFQMIGQSAESTALGVAGLAASGALIGSTFGPWGTVIGGAVGALAGLTKAMFTSGESAEQFNAKVANLSRELTGLGEKAAARKFFDEIGESALEMQENFRIAEMSLRTFIDESGMSGRHAADIWRDAGDQVSEFERKFAALAKTAPAQAQTLLSGLRQLRDEAGKPIIPEHVIAKLEKDLARGEAAYAKTTAKAREQNAANQELTASASAFGEASSAAAEEASKAWEKYIDELKSGTPTIRTFFEEAANAVKNWQDASSPEQLIENFKKQLEAFQNFADNVKHFASVGLDDLASTLAQMGPKAGGAIAQALRDASPEVQQEMENMLDAGRTELDAFVAWLTGDGAQSLRNSAAAAGAGVGPGMAGGIDSTKETAATAVTGLVTNAQARFAIFAPSAGEAGSAGGGSFAVGLGGKAGEAGTAANTVKEWALTAIRGGDFAGAGADAGQGFANGVLGKKGAAAAAAREVASAAAAAMRSALQEQSPSRVTMEIGEFFGEGFQLGIRRTMPDIVDTVTQVGKAASDAFERGLSYGGGDFTGASLPDVASQRASLPASTLSAEEIARQSAARAAANAALGINVGLLEPPPGFVHAPVGVRSSDLWTQEMVEAFDRARPLAERIAMAEQELAKAQDALTRADVEGWMAGINGASEEVMAAAAKAQEVARQAVEQAQATLDALKSGQEPGTPGGVPNEAPPPNEAEMELAVTQRDMLVAVQQSLEVHRQQLGFLQSGSLSVIVAKMPEPTPTVGQINVDVHLGGGQDPASARAAAQAGVAAALAEAGLTTRSAVATIKALG